MSEHNILLAQIVRHQAPREYFFSFHGVVTECFLALEGFHTILVTSSSPPLNQVHNINMRGTNDLA